MKSAFKTITLLLIGLIIYSTMPVLAQTVLADTGFRPQQNGFSFANYGNETQPVNLTAASMQKVFGNTVCKAIQNGSCVLTATAQVWMDKINNDMDGGHCEGMAALSKLIYTGQVNLKDLDPNANSISDLKPDNPRVQEEIARWFATQYVPPTADKEIRDQNPTQIVDTLINNLQSGSGPFTMGIYEAGGGGGHAITPYSVVDMGNGTVRVMVYDNNYPGEERFIEVDRNANTWKYTGSTNPNEPATTYSGDASSFSLTLTPATARTQVPQECTFCKPGDGGLPNDASGTTDTTGGQTGTDSTTTGGGTTGGGTTTDNTTTDTGAPTPVGDGCGTAVTTGANTDLVVTTADGHKAGVLNGQSFSDIEGALVLRPRSQTGLNGDTPGAVVILPSSSDKISMTVKGDGGNNVLVTDCGQYQQVQGLSQQNGQSDTLVFDPAQNAITGEVDPDESLTISGGYNNPNGNDFTYTLDNVSGAEGAVYNVGANPETGEFFVSSDKDLSFDASFGSIDPEGAYSESAFTGAGTTGGEGLALNADDAVYSEEPEVATYEEDPALYDDYMAGSEEDEASFDELDAEFGDEGDIGDEEITGDEDGTGDEEDSGSDEDTGEDDTGGEEDTGDTGE